jgi:hypothetical protein
MSAVDRMLWPALEAIQILRKTYGNNTYVARKRTAVQAECWHPAPEVRTMCASHGKGI